jgi:outer membrane protein
MKNLILALVAIVTLASCQQNKIGFVDNGTVINGIQEKLDIESKFDGLNESFKASVDSISNVYQLEYKTLQEKTARMSQSKQQEAMQPFQVKAQQFQQLMQTEKQKMQSAYQADMDSLIVKMKTTVKEYGKNNGYNFILGTNVSIGSVLYGEEGSDLTEIIIKELDSKYKK